LKVFFFFCGRISYLVFEGLELGREVLVGEAAAARRLQGDTRNHHSHHLWVIVHEEYSTFQKKKKKTFAFPSILCVNFLVLLQTEGRT
jgi:hypothetical protein